MILRTCLALLLGLFLLVPAPAIALDFNKEILIGQDFSGRDLSDASFTKSNIREADFRDATLIGVSFFGANLESTNLANADLRGAILDSARMTNANLDGARLEGAYAFATLFGGASIVGADFTDVLMREDAQELLCKVASGINPMTGRATRDTLNCD